MITNRPITKLFSNQQSISHIRNMLEKYFSMLVFTPTIFDELLVFYIIFKIIFTQIKLNQIINMNSLQTEDSCRMILDKQIIYAKTETKLEEFDNDIILIESDVDQNNIKQVDSSSGPCEEDDFHLGILEQDNQKSNKQEENDLNQQMELMQINIIALNQAVSQRKTVNFRAITKFVQQHSKYYNRHMDVLVDLQINLVARLQKSKQFFTEVYNYFYLLNQISMNSQNSNISIVFVEEQKKSTYAKIIDALKNIVIIRQDFQQKMNVSSSWIPNQFLIFLAKSFAVHQNTLNYYLTQIYKAKIQTDQKLKKVNTLYKRLENLILFGVGNKQFDLLSEELMFFQNIKENKQVMVKWGLFVNTLWVMSQKGELSILQQIQKHIDLLFESCDGLLQSNQNKDKAYEYWKSFNVEDQIKSYYHIHFIVKDEHYKMIQKILGKENLKNQDYERFVKLQHEIKVVGDQNQLKNILILKKFSCKAIQNKNKVEDINIYSSLDGFCVFTHRKGDQLFNTMLLRNTTCNRISLYVVEVKEKKPGFFRDSWNRLQLQFANTDEAQEFLVFLANSEQERDGIIQ